jgi:hypothetical protein
MSNHTQEECALHPSRETCKNGTVLRPKMAGGGGGGACYAHNDGKCSVLYCRFNHVCSVCVCGGGGGAQKSRQAEDGPSSNHKSRVCTWETVSRRYEFVEMGGLHGSSEQPRGDRRKESKPPHKTRKVTDTNIHASPMFSSYVATPHPKVMGYLDTIQL